MVPTSLTLPAPKTPNQSFHAVASGHAPILVFWLGTTAWLIQREVLPGFTTGRPPPFVYDYMDDSRPIVFPSLWSAVHTYGPDNDRRTATYHLETGLRHHDRDDVFELTATMQVRRSETDEPDRLLTLKSMATSYLADRRGRLVGLTTRVTDGIVAIAMTGEVEDDVLRLSRENGGESLDIDLRGAGSVLLPLHPVQRIAGLHPGRRWSIPLFDPLDLSSKPVLVDAHVRDEVVGLVVNGKPFRCRAIDYESRGKDIEGVLWVDVADDRLLKMTVRLKFDRWEIVRK